MCEKSKKAEALFAGGFNCAQSVLGAFCEDYGLEIAAAFKVSAGLGGGVRMGEICGAASGAALVIGLKYGQFPAGDKDAKAFCNSKVAEFMAAFKARNRSVVCREILGLDVSVPEEYAAAQERNLFKTTCADMVRGAAELLLKLGY